MKTLRYRAADGTELAACLWEPPAEQAPEGLLLALHGMGGAATEMAPLGEFLRGRGWLVAAPNLRANGLDPDVPRRGHFFSIPGWQADIESFWEALQPVLPPQIPVFLFGESMGAMLSIAFATTPGFKIPLRGLILAAPVFELRQKTPAPVRILLRLLAAVFPRMVIPPSIFVHGKPETPRLTRDPVYQEYTLTAPHRIAAYTISFTAGVDALMRRAREAATALSLPFLLLGGEDDVFIAPETLRAWFHAATSPDKTLRIFPGTHHILLHELNTLQILETLHDWLSARTSPARQNTPAPCPV